MKQLWSMAEKIFIDTNIFIYFLFNIDKDKHGKCVRLFEKARRGKINLWTTEWVVAEIIWFLQRRGTDWKKIKQFVISGMLSHQGLEVRERKWLLEIIERCQTGREFVDSINISLSKKSNIKRGYSYDKGLDRWKIFKRLEP